uniref:Protein asunder n=1 Tax=Ascaris lumbricoides TaxID=6252 RepID=A0A0M3I0T6_ASCLU
METSDCVYVLICQPLRKNAVFFKWTEQFTHQMTGTSRSLVSHSTYRSPFRSSLQQDASEANDSTSTTAVMISDEEQRPTPPSVGYFDL